MFVHYCAKHYHFISSNLDWYSILSSFGLQDYVELLVVSIMRNFVWNKRTYWSWLRTLKHVEWIIFWKKLFNIVYSEIFYFGIIGRCLCRFITNIEQNLAEYHKGNRIGYLNPIETCDKWFDSGTLQIEIFQISYWNWNRDELSTERYAQKNHSLDWNSVVLNFCPDHSSEGVA